jgi:glycosyltransferase involved in cell wall biosynthesis
MKKQIVLTIITPVYNCENYISETIESVLNSKILFPYEYIVLDDGSSDASSKIVEKYEGLIKIFSHANIGESLTVNRGLNAAKGEFILVLNADDPLLTPDLINYSCKYLLDNPNIDAVYPDWKVIDKNGVNLRVNILPNYSDEIFIGRNRCLPGPGTIFRRNIALKIGGRSPSWKFVGDYDFWLRFSKVGTIERFPGVLAQWRENSNSTSISYRGSEMANERINVITNFLETNKVSPKLARKAVANSYYLAARLGFFDSNMNSKQLLIKSFKHRRGWPEEAKLHVVIYLLLLPISKNIFNSMPNALKKVFVR